MCFCYVLDIIRSFRVLAGLTNFHGFVAIFHSPVVSIILNIMSWNIIASSFILLEFKLISLRFKINV